MSVPSIVCERCEHDHWCEHDDADHGFCCKCDGENRHGANSCGPWEGIGLARSRPAAGTGEGTNE